MIEVVTPYYIVYEDRIRRNLRLINRVSQESGIKIIMAFKANALWRTFGIVREYCQSATASSLNEMRLAREFLGADVHCYCPVYTEESFPQFAEACGHMVFNSIEQFNRFIGRIKVINATRNVAHQLSAGLRINPECSVIDTDIYNPCRPGSRFGVTIDRLQSQFGGRLPDGLEGFHFHCLCESTSYDLAKVLAAVEEKFGDYLPQLKWLNMGGGHLMTRKGYDVEHLIDLLRHFGSRYPNLKLIMEPGSAFMWRTGDLVATVLDVVENQGIKTAIIDASFACHMPDCLEMPYKPTISEALADVNTAYPTYRIGGNSCLSGDFIGDWSFEKPLLPGDRLTFEDMNHYTTVKTNMFNGLQHPSILLQHADGRIEVLRQYSYEDYKCRMD